MRYWKDTPLETALQELAGRNVPLGGTSAGLAVLGQFIYTGENQSVTSPEALANPYNKNVTLGRDFLALPAMGRVITDSHLDTRDRLGRLIVFVARAAQRSGQQDMVGLGVDEDTALCVEADGTGQVLSRAGGYAWLVMPQRTPDRLRGGQPLDFRAIPVTGVGEGSRLHLDGFQVDDAAFEMTADIRKGRLQLR